MKKFSIVVPTYNRPERIVACVAALSKQNFPRTEFEVIVVDDGSPQEIAGSLETFHSQCDLKVIRQNNAGPASARNRGLAEASGEFVAYTDDDCCPEADWLEKLQRNFDEEPRAAVGGRVVNVLRDNPYAIASQLLIDYLYEYYNQRKAAPTFFASNNLAFPRQALQELHGFSTDFPLAAAEDREMCDRWLRHGYSLRYDPEAIVLHSHHMDLGKFWRQHFNYGRGAFRFHEVRAAEGSGKRELEPISFYGDLVKYPYRKARHAGAGLLAMLMVVSQAANGAGYFWEKHTPAERG